MTPAILPLKQRSCPFRFSRRNPAPEACLAIGRHYLESINESMLPRWREAFRRYSAWTERLFRLVLVKVHFTEQDPYDSAPEMRKAVLSSGVMRVFSGGSEHPLLSPEQNLRGRAVHDLFAHLVCGCPFTATGEFNAFEAQAAIYPVEVRPLLFCEIVGQTCAYLVNGCVHAEQKLVQFGERFERAAESMRRQFPKGLGLAGAVERGLISSEVFKVAEETGYALRYSYAILETQQVAAVEALKNPGARWQDWPGYEAPLWAPWFDRVGTRLQRGRRNE